jgi:hypothetical protein
LTTQLAIFLPSLSFWAGAAFVGRRQQAPFIADLRAETSLAAGREARQLSGAQPDALIPRLYRGRKSNMARRAQRCPLERLTRA